MRVRWKDFELPTRVSCDEKTATPVYGMFFAEPFERGFANTIGNSLRRVLYSSIEGTAVTGVKVKGVAHEFSTIEGILEDVTDIVLNLKQLVVKIAEPGEVLGASATILGKPYEVSAETIEPAQLNFIKRDEFLKDVSDWVPRITRAGQKYFETVQEQLSELADVSQRIATGEAENDDEDRAKALQSNLNMPFGIDQLSSRSEWLGKLDQKLDELESLKGEIEGYLGSLREHEMDKNS